MKQYHNTRTFTKPIFVLSFKCWSV